MSEDGLALLIIAFVVVTVFVYEFGYDAGFKAGVKAQYEQMTMDADAYLHSDNPVNPEVWSGVNDSVEPMSDIGRIDNLT